MYFTKREREREKEKRLEQARIKKIYNNQRKEYNLLIQKIFSKDQNKIKKNIDLTIHLYEKKIINSLRTFGPLDEDQTLKKLLEISTNPKAQEILTIENDRVKRLKTKERGAQRRREEAREQREKERIKLELIKKEKLELDKKKYFDEKLKKELLNEKKKKELEKKISNFVQKKIKFLMSKNKVKNLIKKFIHKDEVIKFIDYGTLNVSSLSPPGYLILTDKRFLFHSKFLFLKESLTEIPLSNVLGVIFDKSLLKTNIVKFKIKDQKDLVYKDLADSLSDAWNDAWNVEENSDFSIQYLKLIFNQN